MPDENARPSHPAAAVAAAIAGALALAAAMGIGRFAFTPVLPLMLRSGALDVAAGGWLAAANYAGYFVGALTAARVPLAPRQLALLALAAIAASTAGMAVNAGAWLWAALRFGAGVASAWAFVGTSAWCLALLAARGRAGWGGLVYAGVGGGIALVGLHCLLAGRAGASPSALWLQLGGFAAFLAMLVALVGRRPATTPAAPAAAPAAPDRSGAPRGTGALVACYGLMGFGYILPATYLPVLARQVVDDPAVFGLAWPLFGATAALSTLLAGALARRVPRLAVWAAAQGLMGAGVLLPALRPGGASIALAAVLVGGTFMVVTMVGMQEARERAGARPTAWLARMTAAFALGQIAGPLVATALAALAQALGRPADAALPAALCLAAVCLLGSAAWLARAAARNLNTPNGAPP